MLIAMGITASLTATITSTLTSGSLLQGVQVPQTLSQTQVGSIDGSKSAQYLKNEEIQFQTFSEPMQGLRAVNENTIDLFVYEAATLNYLNRNSFNKLLSVQNTEIPAVDYAFALPEGDIGFEVINQQLLQETSEADWQDLLNRYLPEEN
jgi:ABC-type amino acid transport substrate-binding protein